MTHPASGLDCFGFIGSVIKWVLLVWVGMDPRSYWIGLGWVGLGIHWVQFGYGSVWIEWWVESSSVSRSRRPRLDTSRLRRPPSSPAGRTGRPTRRSRSAPAALSALRAGRPTRRPRRPPSAPAALRQAQHQGRLLAHHCWQGTPHSRISPPVPSFHYQIIEASVFPPIGPPPFNFDFPRDLKILPF